MSNPERELNIKIAQLNAKLQIEVTAFFSFVALSLGALITAFQFGLPSLGKLTNSMFAAIAFIAIAVVAIIGAVDYLTKLNSTEKEFNILK